MSTQRRQHARHLKDATGQTICSCGCGQVPVRPRKTWFSDACVQAWKEINDPETIRRAVFKRDGGLCRACGVDCNKAYAEWKRHTAEASRFVWWIVGSDRWNTEWNEQTGRMELRNRPTPTLTEHRRRLAALKAKWNPPGNWTSGRSTGWDADHIVPVVEGGGLCGLDNYQILCHPCHKKATRELAARLAARRAEAKREADPTPCLL